MSDPVETHGLIEGIYAAALDSARWPAFMEKLGSTLKAGFGNLWLLDTTNWTFNNSDSDTVCAFSGLDASTVNRYKEEYAPLNVWLPNALDLPEGALTVSSALYPDARLKGTEFYDVFLRPNDLYYAVGSSVVKRGNANVRMSFVRSERAGRYDADELHLVQQLMPHLRNAVVLHGELYRSRALAASALAALELVPAGVILLTATGRLLHANQRALDLCARTKALHFRTGRIHADRLNATAALQRLIQDAVGTGTGNGTGHGGALQLVSADGRRLQVLVTPLPAHETAICEGARAAIFCNDPEAVVGALSHRLELIYGMTPAEALLTEALVNGQTLQEYADARSVTISTVRAQFKVAVAKAGARSQADLVRVVLTGPAVFKQPAQPLPRTDTGQAH